MPPLLEVKNLKKYFDTLWGQLHAVDGISFKMGAKQTLGIVGESGCGKSTLGRVIVRLYEPTNGEIHFKGENVTQAKGGKLKRLRERMQFIFQDPFSSLNPRMTVEEIIGEPLFLMGRYTKKELTNEVQRLMESVGIESRLKFAYPHELDGGMRQRVGIARALATKPDLIVCDEPISALDVSIRAQILNLLLDLQDARGMAYIFITHDLSVAKHICNEICVMYLGQFVEKSASEELFRLPLHPYTKALLSAIPSINIHKKRKRIILEGEVPSPINPEPGCRFASRCKYVSEKCKEPQFLEEVLPQHFVACWKAKEINDL
jgi:peptide/nickel transport system ATP-binding protein